MEREARTLQVAEEISRLLQDQGHPSAIVGAIALAVHNYVRATRDIDLGVSIYEPQIAFRVLEAALPVGYQMKTRYADYEDDLGGVATITGPDILPIQIVNFTNSKRLRKSPGSAGVREATLLVDEAGDLKVVSLPYLIAMKLEAGALKDKADVVELLRANPEAPEAEIRAVCAEFRLENQLDEILGEVER